MRVLILGGTGAMGGHVAKILELQGYEVYITTRQQKSSEGLVHYIQGNAKNLSFVTSLCKEKWDVIIDFMVYKLDELMERIDLLLSSTSQYVFISSARVYADMPLITEDSPRLLDVCDDKEYLATNEYAIAKAKEENVLLSSKKKNWTIVRPSLTYAENRLQLGVYEKENWLFRALHGRSIVFSKDLMDKYYTLSYGKDVADGIAGLVGKENAIGQIFHIVVKDSFQWKDILNIYLNTLEEKTGKRPKVVITDKCTNLQIPEAKYQVLYGRYFNRHFDNTKIKSIVDDSKWLLPQEGLKKCLETFLENPSFLYIDGYKEALLDRAAGEWTPIWQIPGKKNKLVYLKHRILG